MKISLVAFDDFTDIDLWFMWDLLNRVKDQGWNIKILGSKKTHISHTGVQIPMHGFLAEANDSDIVLFFSGPGTRKVITDFHFLSTLNLSPERQLIGSICSGALILAALGILKPGDNATTYPSAKAQLESFQINVLEQPIVYQGNVATAAGCLAAQTLVGWVIERTIGTTAKDAVLDSIKPVGEGLSYYS